MKRFISLAVVTIMLISIFAGCTSTSKKEALITQFLNAHYTIDDPEKALEDIARWDAKGDTDVLVNILKERFQTYFTDDGFLYLVASAWWLPLYVSAATLDQTVKPEKLLIEEVDKNQYQFSLIAVITDAKNAVVDEIPQNGKILLGKGGKIERFTIDNGKALVSDKHSPPAN
ncbi:MAG: hypothetical protein RSE97_00495 [Oscillospiraceae bacterium]